MFKKFLPETESIIFYCLGDDYPKPHCHNYWEFLIMLKGKITHTMNGVTEYLSKNDIVLLKPNDVHCFSGNTPHSHLHILINEKVFETEIKSCDYDIIICTNPTTKSQKYYLDKEQLDNIETIIHSLQTLSSCKQTELKLSKILFRTVLNYYLYHILIKESSHKKYPASFTNIYNLILKKENISKSIEDIRILCGYSQSQFYRLFIKYTSLPPVRFFQNIKLNHAAHLLKTTDFKIIDISTESGYCSISHFNTKFKELYGITPCQYRQNKLKY